MNLNDKNVIYQKRPSQLPHDRWQEATPLGNGNVGALVFGDIAIERIRFTKSDLWRNGNDPTPPDVSYTLAETRRLLDEKDYYGANFRLFNALKEKGYAPKTATPFPIGDLTLSFRYPAERPRAYRRALALDKGECEVSFGIGKGRVNRSCFVSRADGLFYMKIEADEPISVTLSLAQPYLDHPTDQPQKYDFPHSNKAENGTLVFTREGGKSGCALTARAVETDGAVTLTDEGITVCDFRFFVFALRASSDRCETAMPTPLPYAEALALHTARHGELFCRADLHFDDPENVGKSNEDLLLETFDAGVCPALLEKLWRFGRYLFIAGTGDLPFPLYGLWGGDYDLQWAQHVVNENVQIIHWHAQAGGLSDLLPALIRYYTDKIPAFREDAKNLFGCRGIVVSVYTTPIGSHVDPPVPVILNFTMCSGWLCHHFFDYYRMTLDEKTLTERILPFAYETALFIEDYAVIRDGKLLWYPSVSPENSPAGFVRDGNPMSHAMPTAKNATVELALVKETLSRLLALCRERNLHAEKWEVWERLLAAIAPYGINGDGAVREWQTDEFRDFYCHRHASHVYPVFPGNEVRRQNDPALHRAFERALDLRELDGQSNWSFPQMGAMYLRFGRPEQTYTYLDYLCASCLLDNLFTVSNDWRQNGLTLVMDNPPVQLDALLGVVNVLQMMLLDENGDVLHLYEGLPKALKRGNAAGLTFSHGKVDFTWDAEKGEFNAVLTAARTGEISLDCPYGEAVSLHVEAGKAYPLSWRVSR